MWQAEPMADRPLASAPPGRIEVPRAVDRLADGDHTEPVWENELGGLTFRIAADRYVKWIATGTPEIDFTAEAERLRWAGHFTPVPQVLDRGSDDDGEWLMLAALPGQSAVHPRWLVEPETAARAIGEALRAMHDDLPVDTCPFSWRVEERTADLDTARCSRLAPAPGIDRLVVCHGDPCAPNTILDDGGRWVGHVDLGHLGVADRWADLAVGSWSLEWNYGCGFEASFFDAYDITPDPERIAFYRTLWDLG
jgi:kanamycin kinase